MKITENIGVGLHNVNSNHTVIIIVFSHSCHKSIEMMRLCLVTYTKTLNSPYEDAL